MKIILTQEVEGLGAAGDVIEVKDGYGRNYLLPRGFAIRWTRGGQKQVDAIKYARSSRAVRDEAHAAEIKAKLEAAVVDLKVQAGTGGRLFGSVTVTDVADGSRRGHRRGDRQAHHRARQPDQEPRRSQRVGQVARRRVGRGRAQCDPCLSNAPQGEGEPSTA